MTRQRWVSDSSDGWPGGRPFTYMRRPNGTLGRLLGAPRSVSLSCSRPSSASSACCAYFACFVDRGDEGTDLLPGPISLPSVSLRRRGLDGSVSLVGFFRMRLPSCKGAQFSTTPMREGPAAALSCSSPVWLPVCCCWAKALATASRLGAGEGVTGVSMATWPGREKIEACWATGAMAKSGCICCPLSGSGLCVMLDVRFAYVRLRFAVGERSGRRICERQGE